VNNNWITIFKTSGNDLNQKLTAVSAVEETLAFVPICYFNIFIFIQQERRHF